jgi:hypothetical protein
MRLSFLTATQLEELIIAQEQVVTWNISFMGPTIWPWLFVACGTIGMSGAIICRLGRVCYYISYIGKYPLFIHSKQFSYESTRFCKNP